MKTLFIAIMFLCSNTVAAQRAAVSRTTGVPVSCAELDCSEEDSTYQDLDRNCLNCLMRLSDSVMLEEKRKVLQKCEGRKEGCKSFIKDQNTWESKREKMATKESNKYKGGSMEMIEYVRTKLIETNKRIVYLRRHVLTLDSQ